MARLLLATVRIEEEPSQGHKVFTMRDVPREASFPELSRPFST